MIEEKELHKCFKIRWKSSIEAKGLPIPGGLKEDLWEKLLERFRTGFKCAYCGRQMMIQSTVRPPQLVLSFDHKHSVYSGGDNALENITFVCCGCNLMKGTASSETWKEVISHLMDNPKLIHTWFKESWPGKLAEKLNRKDQKRL